MDPEKAVKVMKVAKPKAEKPQNVEKEEMDWGTLARELTWIKYHELRNKHGLDL